MKSGYICFLPFRNGQRCIIRLFFVFRNRKRVTFHAQRRQKSGAVSYTHLTAKRAELMHQAEDMLMETGALMPIYFYTDNYLQKEYLSNVYTTPFGYKYFMFANLDNGSDTLRICLASEPDKLDPALNSTVDGACLAINAFAGLMTYNEEGQQVNDLAESVEMSEDGLTYTVTLKDDLKWSNGCLLDTSRCV